MNPITKFLLRAGSFTIMNTLADLWLFDKPINNLANVGIAIAVASFLTVLDLWNPVEEE